MNILLIIVVVILLLTCSSFNFITPACTTLADIASGFTPHEGRKRDDQRFDGRQLIAELID